MRVVPDMPELGLGLNREPTMEPNKESSAGR